MPEPVIIDTTVIQVKSTSKDNYGNLIVTPTEGKDVKISEKRSNLFDIFQEGRAVKLYWAEYMHRKFVSKAEPFDGKPPMERQIGEIKPYSKEELSRDERIDRAVWYKELGECLRSGEIDKTTPHGGQYRKAYYTEMNRVLGINFKEVQPIRKNLVEEAKRLGAKEDVPF